MNKIIAIAFAAMMTTACTGNKYVDTGLWVVGTAAFIGAVNNDSPRSCPPNTEYRTYYCNE